MVPLSSAAAFFDVCVIGGGPAGAAAARMLAARGHSVVVANRSARPRALAESLPPSCGKLLDRLALRDIVDSGSFIRATGNTVRWAGADARIEMFDAGTLGYQVPREAFDALLLAAAAAAGASVRNDTVVLDATRVDERWRVSVTDRAGAHVICSRWLLDCSGRGGVIAARGYRQPRAGSRTLAVAAVWQRDDAWRVKEPSHTLVESYDDGWAWSVPLARDRRVVTVMLDPSMTNVGSRATLAESYRRELARTSMIEALIDGATVGSEPWGCDASPYTATRAADDGMLLVGDASSFIDPLSSFGVKKALASGWLASVVVHSALTDSASTSYGAALFDERERAMYLQLQRQSTELASGAAAAHASAFWTSRAFDTDADSATGGAIDIASLRDDARIAEAFEELKRRPSLGLRTTANLSLVDRAIVKGDRVLLEQHLVGGGLRTPTRYFQNIDLLALVNLAPNFNQVPDLFDAYNRVTRSTSIPLPAFLAALSTLIGLELLTFA